MFSIFSGSRRWNVRNVENGTGFQAAVKLITLLGYNGLVIMIDEMDLILSERSDIRSKSYHNLRYLIDQTIGGHIPNTCFIFSGSDVLFTDEEKGLRTYDALSQRLGQALDISTDTLLDIRQPVMYLKRLDFEVYGVLAEKLTHLYKKVFDLNLTISTDSLKNWVFLTYKEQGKEYNNVTIREFITKYIELMDIIHQNPDHQMFKSDLYAELQRNKLVFKSKLTTFL